MKMKVLQIIKHLIIGLILIGIGTSSARSQTMVRVNIQKDIKVDTLSLTVHYPADFDFARQARYNQKLEQAIQKANSKFTFHTELGKQGTEYSINLEMGSIIYTTKKDDLNASIFHLLFIGGHAAMIGIFGWTLPILIYSSPDTTSEIIIYVDENLTDQSTEIESKFQSNGYFASVERQDKRFERRFEKSLFKMVKHINKQNVRNNKNR